MKNLLIVFFVFITAWAQAQNGKIRGTVIDDTTGETLVGVAIVVEGTGTGTITDLDGKFSLDLEEGNYNLKVAYISYEPRTIEGVQVKANDINVLGDIRLGQNIQDIEEVVVKAKVIRTTETAIQTMKKKSTVMLDGISAAKIQLIGDATAVEAAKRITGVSIQDGKYVYVRGLGDRYSKTTLNGMDIPGLDPDRNSIQMDIFPTNLINNMMVSKNFTADLPADFTGGIMNVETKDFPERKIFSVSLGTSYNPDMHFNSDYLTYDGGSTDFLGFDDGTRALPSGAKSNIFPIKNTDAEVSNFVRGFNSTLGGTRETSPVDFSLGISFGNQIDLETSDKNVDKAPKLGYILSASYKSKYKYYDNILFGEYQLNPDKANNEMVYATKRDGNLGEREVLVGLLGGIAYKTNFSKLRLTLMHLQSGQSTAGIFNVDNSNAAGQSGYKALSNNLEYNQRSLTNLFLNGKHVYADSDWEIDWRISPTLSKSDDPDIRKTAFSINDLGDMYFSSGEGGMPSRIWRSLLELSANAKIDFTKKYKFNSADAKLKFGLNGYYKSREYEILEYSLKSNTSRNNWDSSDANLVLIEENLFTGAYDAEGKQLYYKSDYSDPNSNEYKSNARNLSAYISNEFNVFPRLKTTVGVRVENYVMRHTGRDQAYASGNTIDGNNLDNDIVLDDTGIFPTLNLIYTLNEDQNLRAAYSRTIARPSFKEMSFAQIIDPLSNSIFNGGLFKYDDWDGNLVSTYVNNFDLRWELFGKDAQMISFSGFFKQFKDPIELVRIPQQITSTEYQPRNVGDAQLIGLEFEFKKNLGFVSLENLNLSGNLTLVDSEVEMTDAEYTSRKNQERTTGENVDNKRVMAGQAPYVVNAGLTYGIAEKGFDAGVFYNVKGETLSIVGGGIFPDVYVKPFHSLNLSVNKKFGTDNRMLVEFKVSNLLNNDYDEVYKAYEAQDQIFKRYSPGQSFSVGFKYKL